MTSNLKKLLSTVAMAGFLSAGCLGGSPAQQTTNPTTTPTTTNDPGVTPTSDPTQVANDPTNSNNTTGNDNTTFDHMNDDAVDPFQVLARIQEEGPPEVATRMHSCGKMKYATLKNVLTSVGVNMAQTGATQPGGLYTSGAGALGKPDYANRLAEGTALTTAGAVRLYDIFVAAAPQVIASMPTNTRCGASVSMFDANGCTMAAITCLTGAPATQAQKDLCDSAVASNTTDMVGTNTVGQIVAVASLLSAAHSCE